MPRIVVVGALVAAVVALGACTLLTSTSGLSSANPPGPDAANSETGAPIGTPSGGPTDGGDGGTGSAYREAVLADEPAAYFRFEEATGTGCADEVTGSRFTCVYGGTGITRGAAGITSSASVRLTADGTISIATESIDFAQPYMLEFWIELDEPTPGEGIVSTMTGLTDTTRIGFTAFLFLDTGAFRTEMWNTQFQNYTLAGNPPTAAVWHHIVNGHDASGDFTYFDGAKSSGGSSQDPAGNPKSSIPLVFRGFAGRLDEVAWYDHVLRADRILAHYGLE